MSDTDIDNGKPLPPPKRGNSFGNLKTKTVREVKRPVGRPPNDVPLVAITCKLLPDVKDRFEALEAPFLQARQKGRRTDFVDALLLSFEAAKANGTAEPPAPPPPRTPETERRPVGPNAGMSGLNPRSSKRSKLRTNGRSANGLPKP